MHGKHPQEERPGNLSNPAGTQVHNLPIKTIVKNFRRPLGLACLLQWNVEWQNTINGKATKTADTDVASMHGKWGWMGLDGAG